MTGNFAFYDQIEALRWIQRHISAFRGDPNKVTIFGNSSGGGSVGILLISPLAKGKIGHYKLYIRNFEAETSNVKR